MASRKLVCLKKKVREKMNAMQEQRNICMALVDSFVSEARDQADRLLDEHDPGRFMDHYLDVMKILDQAYNSCVMLTAEAEGLCESVDITANSIMENQISDNEDDSVIEGAMAASCSKSLKARKTESGNHCDRNISMKCTEEGSHVSSAHNSDKPKSILTGKNDQNLTRNLNKPSVDKCVDTLHVDRFEQEEQDKVDCVYGATKSNLHLNESTSSNLGESNSVKPGRFGDHPNRKLGFNDKDIAFEGQSEDSGLLASNSSSFRKSVTPETKQKVESKHKKSKAKTGQPKLDTNAATRFMRNIIAQAEKDNMKRLSQQKSKDTVSNQDSTRHLSADLYNDSSSIPFKVNNEEVQLPNVQSSIKENKSEEKTSASPQKSVSLTGTFGNKFCLTGLDSPMKVKTDTPVLEMNIKADSFTLSATSIGQISLPVSRATPVVVTETRSPWGFYVQVVNNVLDNMMQDIRKYIESGEDKPECVQAVEEGMVYLSQFSQDNLFYRAKITEIHFTESVLTSVDVLYIDYGNAENRELSHLRPLPLQFTTLPAQAVYCALAKIAPNNKYGVWSEQDILTFSQLVHSKKFFCTLIQPSQHPDIPNIVDLFFNSTIPGNWTPTPVFIQTILMNSKVGRMITIQEQVTSFVIFFRLSPSSTSSLSPTATSNAEKGETCQKKTDVELYSEPNILGSPVKIQKSCDSIKGCVPHDTEMQKSHDESDRYQDKKPQGKVINCDKSVMKSSAVSVLGSADDESGKCCLRTLDTGSGCTTIKESFETAAKCTDDAAADVTTKSDVPENNPPVSHSCPNGIEASRGIVESSNITNVDSMADILTINHSDSRTADESNNNDVDVNANQTIDTNVPLPVFDKSASCYDVMVSFAKSPSLFFVHIVSEVTATMLNVMSNNINSHYTQLSKKQLKKQSRSFQPKVEDVCCAQFLEDNKFYRAHVLELQEQSNSTPITAAGGDSDSENLGKAKVFYLDYGDTEWVPKKRLFPLPKELQNIPALAVKCSLAFVKPSKYEWTEDVINYFNKVTGDGKDKVIKMILVDGSLEKLVESFNADPISVILVDNSSQEEICVNMDLIKQGHAVLNVGDHNQGYMSSPISPDQLSNWDPMTEDYLSQRNTYKVDVDDAGIATVGYKAQDESRICKYYNYGNCWRGERCPYRHIEITPDGITLDQELVYGAIEEYHVDKILPDPGTWVAVEITTILNPGHFYVSLPFGKSAIDDLKEREDAQLKDEWQMNFNQLITEMQTEYSKAGYNEDTTVDKAPGEIVAAKYSADGKWYRARVLIVEENRVRVFFVDFGNRDWLRPNAIRTILPDFLHLPFQAVECFLLSIEPPGSKYSMEAKQRFKDLVNNKILVAFVKTTSYNGSIWIDLYDTTGEEDIDIAKVLISEKLVQDTGSSTVSSKPSHHSSHSSLILVPG